VRPSKGTTALALVLLGCAVPALRDARLPAPLERLTLVEDHPSISPVDFPHAQHVDPAVMGREVACSECHHVLRDHPEAVPRPCTDCHINVYLMPDADVPEDEEHEHGPIPDL
jgi:hypothetical protein